MHIELNKHLENKKVKAVSKDYNMFVSKCDFAIVTVPNYLHSSISIDLMKKGLHVFCEKPMALNSTDCKLMLKTAKVNNVCIEKQL